MRNLLTLLLLCSSLPSLGAQYARDLRVETPLMLRELGASPAGLTGYGQLYTKTLDNDLYFMDSLGNQFNVLLGGAAGAQLNDLSDVDTFTASPTAGQFLKFNGSLWVPGDIPIINALDDIGDVNVASATEGQVLTRVGTEWQAKDASGGASFAGAVTVPSITDNGGGSVTVGALDVVLFDNATQVGTAKKYSLPALTVTLIDNATNYIIADYAGGSPALANTTNINLINESSVVPIYTIYRSGSFLHIQSWDSLGNGLANKLHQSIVKTQRYRRESGLALGETGTRNVTLGSGIVWTGANSLSLGAISTGTDNLFYFLRTGASTWTTQVVTQYNNTDYWNGTTTASLTNNRYAVNWVYRGVESQKHLYVVLGEGDYTLTQAQASQPPANLPPQITSHALLVGRIIVLKSASTATQIDSSFNVVFSGAGASDHNSLTSLQGGTTGEYYHLTSSQNTAVGTLSSTTTNYVLKRSATGFVNSVIFDNGSFIGIGITTPSARLEVNGNSGYGFPATTGTTTLGVSIRARSAGSVSVLDIGGNLTNGSWLQTNNALDLSTHYPLLINPVGGNVGIGNTAPTTALDVTGDITSSGYVYFGNSTTDGSFRMTVSGGALVVQKRISGVWTQVASFDEN